MIRTWPGQTKEEWEKEYHRNQSLTPEARERELNEFLEKVKKKDEKRELEKRLQEQRNANPFEGCDHPNSLEN